MLTEDTQYFLRWHLLPCTALLVPMASPPLLSQSQLFGCNRALPQSGQPPPQGFTVLSCPLQCAREEGQPSGAASFGPTWQPGMCHVGCKVPHGCPQRALLWPAAKWDDGQTSSLMGKHGFLKWCDGSCQVPRHRVGWALTGLCRYEEHHCSCRAVGFMPRASPKQDVGLWSGRLIPSGSWDCTSYLGSWTLNSGGISCAKGTVVSPYFINTTLQCSFHPRNKNLFEPGQPNINQYWSVWFSTCLLFYFKYLKITI